MELNKQLELLNEINKRSSMNLGEDFDYLFFEGVKYGIDIQEEFDTSDEGKFQCGRYILGVGIVNEENGYGVKDKNYLFYIEQDFTRYGDYWSGYDYDFEEAYLVERKEIVKAIWKPIKINEEIGDEYE